MNILQVHKFYYPRDGASKYCLSLSSELQKLGHTVIPFAVTHPENISSVYEKYFPPYMDLSDTSSLSLSQKIQFARNILSNNEAKSKMKQLLENISIDIAHIHNIYHHISPSIFEPLKKRNIPIVMTIHDFGLISPNYLLFHHREVHEEDAKGWHLRCIKNKCVKDNRLASILSVVEMNYHHKIKKYFDMVDLFIAPSHFHKELCAKYGIAQEKIIHIPNFVDVEKKDFVEGKYIAYFGRISEEKGVQTLLEAAALTSHIPYKIAGEGPELEKLKAFAQQKSLHNVEFVGFLQGKELENFIQDARIVVLPSLCYENSPLSVLEAKMFQKIVLGSNRGGMSEILDKKFLFDPQDSATLAKEIELWYNTSLHERKSIGQTLQQEVLEYNNTEQHLSRILQTYENVKP